MRAAATREHGERVWAKGGGREGTPGREGDVRMSPSDSRRLIRRPGLTYQQHLLTTLVTVTVTNESIRVGDAHRIRAHMYERRGPWFLETLVALSVGCCLCMPSGCVRVGRAHERERGSRHTALEVA